jgi:hypothetical protein
VPALETGRIPAKELPEMPKVSRIEVDKDALQVRSASISAGELYESALRSACSSILGGISSAKGPSTRGADQGRHGDHGGGGAGARDRTHSRQGAARDAEGQPLNSYFGL